MSYSFSGRATDGVVTEWTPVPQIGYGEEESAADIEIIRGVAQTLAANLGGEVSISGGGHSNPNRDPEGTWATDYVSISVTRQK